MVLKFEVNRALCCRQVDNLDLLLPGNFVDFCDILSDELVQEPLAQFMTVSVPLQTMYLTE